MTLSVVFMIIVFGIVSSFCLAALRHLFEYTHNLSQRLETLEKEQVDFVEDLVGEPTEWFNN